MSEVMLAFMALVVLVGVMYGVYMIGVDDGVKKERARRTLYVVQKVFSHDDVEETPPGGGEAQADPCGHGPNGNGSKKQ